MSGHDFERMLRGERLVAATIFYYHPLRPTIINPNSFTIEKIDKLPDLPVLTKLLDHFTHELQVKLAIVRVAVKGIVGTREMRHVDKEWRLH